MNKKQVKKRKKHEILSEALSAALTRADTCKLSPTQTACVVEQEMRSRGLFISMRKPNQWGPGKTSIYFTWVQK